MLCRVLQARLPRSVETVYLANPSVSPDEILHAIAVELQLPIGRDAGRLVVMHALNEYLLRRHAEGRQVVVFVDESQGMPIATLEEIRLLSNLETKQHKLLQIVLFGQPELDDNLRKPEMRQLRERITHSFSLVPLSADEVRAYIAFRLRAAGYHGPDLFNNAGVRYLTHATGGLTRRINIVADKALLAAFAENTHNVNAEASACRGSGQRVQQRGEVSKASTLAACPRSDCRCSLRSVSPSSIYQYGAATGAARAAGPGSRRPPHPEAQPSTFTCAGQSSASPIRARIKPTAGRLDQPEPSASGFSRRPKPPRPRPSRPQPAGAAQAEPDVCRRLAICWNNACLRPNAGWMKRRGASSAFNCWARTIRTLLRSYFETLAKYIEIEKVFVYRTVANQQPSMTVLYGAFASRMDAVKSLEALPEELKANRPYIRTVQGIRVEIGMKKPS